MSGFKRLANAARLLLLICAVALHAQSAAADEPNEYQIKAVFLFNFSRFVEWPPALFKSPTEPFVIGILGTDPFGTRLDEAVRNERVGEHPILVRRLQSAEDITHCQLLFVDRSQGERLAQVLTAVRGQPILTVSELEGSAERGVMVQFVTDERRIRLRINERSARAAGLTISSKLLRLADIVNNGLGD
jgi:hypothetical protein